MKSMLQLNYREESEEGESRRALKNTQTERVAENGGAADTESKRRKLFGQVENNCTVGETKLSTSSLQGLKGLITIGKY